MEETATIENPVLTETVQPDTNGDFPVDFGIMNGSPSTAEAIDFWIAICDQCSFAKEPVGFEKASGADDHIRHKTIESLNPGVSFEKTTILVKSLATGGFFQIAFRYSCKTCGGKMSQTQVATIWEGSSLSPSMPQ